MDVCLATECCLRSRPAAWQSPQEDPAGEEDSQGKHRGRAGGLAPCFTSPEVCYRGSSWMRLARSWQRCQDACLKGTRTRARCCCSDPPCRGHWRRMTSGSTQAVRPPCKPASTLPKVPRAWCAACCGSSSAERQISRKAGPQQARPCLHSSGSLWNGCQQVVELLPVQANTQTHVPVCTLGAR